MASSFSSLLELGIRQKIPSLGILNGCATYRNSASSDARARVPSSEVAAVPAAAEVLATAVVAVAVTAAVAVAVTAAVVVKVLAAAEAMVVMAAVVVMLAARVGARPQFFFQAEYDPKEFGGFEEAGGNSL